jgi:hypothetical protein
METFIRLQYKINKFCKENNFTFAYLLNLQNFKDNKNKIFKFTFSNDLNFLDFIILLKYQNHKKIKRSAILHK